MKFPRLPLPDSGNPRQRIPGATEIADDELEYRFLGKPPDHQPIVSGYYQSGLLTLKRARTAEAFSGFDESLRKTLAGASPAVRLGL